MVYYINIKEFTNSLIVALGSRSAMHAALFLLLLVACTSNILASASPTPVIEPRALTEEQLHPLSGSGRSAAAVRGRQVHQPRELTKRYITQTDHRVLRIAIDTALAAALGIAETYVMQFQYRYDSSVNAIQHAYENSNGVTMNWPAPLIVNDFDNGVDVAIPAMITAIAGTGSRLLATFAWGARLRTDVNIVVGMALMQLEIVTLQGINLIAPGMYSWTFNEGSLPP